MAVVATTTYLYVDTSLTQYYVQGSELVDTGAWSSLTFYNPNDVIQVGVDQYICLTANSNTAPTGIVDENWSTLVVVEEGSGSVVTAGSDYYARYLAEQAYNLASYGTTLGTQAYNLAFYGTALGTQAYNLATIAFAIGTDAYALAVAGTAAQSNAIGTAAYHLAETGTNIGWSAFHLAETGTNIASSAFAIAVAGTDAAANAYDLANDAWILAQIGTNTGTAALTLAESGSNTAWAAYVLAQVGTNIPDFSAGGTMTGNLTVPNLVVGTGTVPTSEAVSGTLYYDMSGPAYQLTTADVAFRVSAKNFTNGAEICAVIISDGTSRALTYESGFSWFGTQIPYTAATVNNKVLVALSCISATGTNVIGATSAQL